MSEKIIRAGRPLVCDVCGQRIPRGTKCRMVRDDFMPMLVYFEHLRCPPGTAVVTRNTKPNNPEKSNCRCEPALA